MNAAIRKSYYGYHDAQAMHSYDYVQGLSLMTSYKISERQFIVQS